MAKGLDGIKVLELAQAVAAPLAGRMLADFGADVVHIEHPERGDFSRTWSRARVRGVRGVTEEKPVPYNWEFVNRDKRSLTLDVSQGSGQQVLYKMLAQADVFVTSMRPYEIERYHLDYDTLRKLNPRLVYASVTGVGKEGPERDIASYDHLVYWARAGWCYRLAPRGEIIGGAKAAEAFGDSIVSIVLAYGIMTALYIRERTGVGQEVDTSLLHTAIFHRGYELCATVNNGLDLQMPPRLEFGALSNTYQTKDGKHVRLGFVTPERWWPRFCKAIGREDLEHDPRFETTEARDENSVALIGILDTVFAQKTMEEWKVVMGNILPWAPVQNGIELCNDPQAKLNGAFATFNHPTWGPMQVITNPVALSETPAEIKRPAPEHGQHTEEVLLDYGYTWEDIGKFKEQGIIA
ncbi:MAG: CoA transferase [Chloroflexi bacterium]|nr:CoA transferase [Chloroflexota bacterium]